jgi:hypothetical protein
MDLCGLKSYEKLVQALAKNGLQPVKLDETPAPASGVGGDARPLFNALVPCVLGDKPGIIKLTVVREDIPQLLSVGLLEHAGAVIDIAQNKIDFRSFGSSTNMTRIGSGHRTISVAAWKGGSLPIPKQLELEFQLKPGAFDISDVAAGRVYTALSEGGNMDHMVVHDDEWLELFHQTKGVEGWSEHRLGHVFSWMLEGTTGKAEAANQLSENEASRYRSSWIVSSDVQTVVLAELSRSRGLESFDMSVNAQVLGKNSFDSGDRLVQVFSNCPLHLSQKPKCNIDRSPDASSIQPVSEPSCQLKSQSNFPGHEFVSSCAEREPSRESSGKLAWSHPSIVPSEDGPVNQRLPGEGLVEARRGEVRGRDGGPVPPPPSQCCPHPVSYLNKGRNQYGSWKRCNLCKTKLSYQEYGPSNPPPLRVCGGGLLGPYSW